MGVWENKTGPRAAGNLRTGAGRAMSTSRDIDLVKRIVSARYDAEPRIEPLTRYNNLVFRLVFSDIDRVLKLARTAEGAGVRRELGLIEALREHGIPVPHVEYADSEATLVGRPFWIMRSAGDRTVDDWVERPGAERDRLFTEMGEVLARVHQVAFSASGDYAIRLLRRPPEIEQLHGLADWTAARGMLEPSEAQTFKALPLPDPGGMSVCHGDFHPVHCIVRDARISAVVDWEKAWAGNPAIDLAMTHAYLDFYCPEEVTARFLTGYAGSRPVPVGYEKAYLPVRMAQALGMVRAWDEQGRPGPLRRAVGLYRSYLERL